MTLSPSVTSSVGPGELPLYAKTSEVTPGFNERRVAPAVRVTSTVRGAVEAFLSTDGGVSSRDAFAERAWKSRPLHVRALASARLWIVRRAVPRLVRSAKNPRVGKACEGCAQSRQSHGSTLESVSA